MRSMGPIVLSHIIHLPDPQPPRPPARNRHGSLRILKSSRVNRSPETDMASPEFRDRRYHRRWDILPGNRCPYSARKRSLPLYTSRLRTSPHLASLSLGQHLISLKSHPELNHKDNGCLHVKVRLSNGHSRYGTERGQFARHHSHRFCSVIIEVQLSRPTRNPLLH